jgi:serine/threonine protein phosphatase 1
MTNSTRPPFILSDVPGRLFAVGDIHGCFSELSLLLNFLESEKSFNTDDTIIFIGDYIDRGANTASVVQLLIDWSKKYPRSLFLKGNHEQFLIKTLNKDFQAAEHWWKNGAKEALESYGLNFAHLDKLESSLPPEHIDFFTNKLERYIISNEYVFVHAGIDVDKPILTQVDEVIFWVRDAFLSRDVSIDKTIVFGHTPFKDVSVSKGKIGIDTGCVYGGKLSVVNLADNEIYSCGLGVQTVIVGQLDKLVL